jgi:hypothetical protein
VIVGRNRFFLVLRGHDEAREEELDFNALVHDVVFAEVCRGRLPNDGRWTPVEVEPEWKGEELGSVKVTVAGFSRRYGRGVFRDRAVEVVHARRADREEADTRTELSWDVDVRRAETVTRGPMPRAALRHQPYPIVPATPGAFRQEPGRCPAALSLAVTSRVMEELCEASADSLDCERADFLAGHLVQRPDGQVIVTVQRRIPARLETGSSQTRFSFSPLSFHAAQQELAARGSGEVILGWHHNHPPPCGRACLTVIPPCRSESVFFSIHDRIVHRSAFPRPYMVALVSGKGADRRADRPVVRAFGWRRGRIRERPLSILSNES